MKLVNSLTNRTFLCLVSVGVGAAWTLGATRNAVAEGEAAPAAAQHVMADNPVAAGRYLVSVAGCNDCHTPGFMEKGGNVPEREWLTGSPMGWQGPWGTTYASNLRLLLRDMDEDTWVQYARVRDGNPPMPWWSLKWMSEQDLRAIYQYVRSLPEVGEPAPAFVPPDQPVTTPYISLVPQMPKTAPIASTTPAP